MIFRRIKDEELAFKEVHTPKEKKSKNKKFYCNFPWRLQIGRELVIRKIAKLEAEKKRINGEVEGFVLVFFFCSATKLLSF